MSVNERVLKPSCRTNLGLLLNIVNELWISRSSEFDTLEDEMIHCKMRSFQRWNF